LAAGAAAVGFVSTFFSGFADEGAHSFEFPQAPVIVLWWKKAMTLMIRVSESEE
jgi:hypothetical protein